MIYVSTGGFSSLTFEEAGNAFESTSVQGLELSSGKYCNTLDESITNLAKKFDLTLHNYFPVPKKPFVFNLSSNIPNIVDDSLAHAKTAIEMSSKLGIKQYSFHAGYLLDPKVEELGQKIKTKSQMPEAVGLDNFINRVNELSDFASKMDVKLLVENNVLSYENSQSFSKNPLLGVDIEGVSKLFSRLNSDVKLLVDVAHLKVSANSLGFDCKEFLREFDDVIGGYHLSDNCGLIDSNMPYSEESWFWEYLKRDLDYYTIEVYSDSVLELDEQYKMLKKFIK